MNLKILFLDDEPELCEVFSDFFSTPDIEIITFTEPVKAIEYSHKNNLDIIILDYRLPRITGDKIALQMPAEIPKYLLTGELELKLEFEFVAIFKKPFSCKVIQTILDEAWKNKSGKKCA